MRAWSGLGYNRRAKYIKQTAGIIVRDLHGIFPQDQKVLSGFPGIGPNTAGAICAFAFNKPVVFIETNIRRTFIHFFFARKKMIHDREILSLIEKTLDRKNPRTWYWALMDYGSMLGKRAGMMQGTNQNRKSAHYIKQKAFQGSDRQLRGMILKLLLTNHDLSQKNIIKYLSEHSGDEKRSQRVIDSLQKDGLIVRKRDRYFC